jgi:predicted metal-dependent hydrolase
MLKRLRNLISSPVIAPSVVPARGTPGVSPLLRNDPSVEQRAAVLAGQEISYTLKRSSKRRSIGLRIDDRGLTVSMPLRASETWLHSVLQDRANWVVEKLGGWQSRKQSPQCWADGECIPYLGELLTLRVTQSAVTALPVVEGEELRVAVRGEITPEKIAKRVTDWYRRQAMVLFSERIAYFAPLLNVTVAEIKISVAKTRWGSCTARGTVRLNLQLVKLPQRLTDYVVVHELAHRREMNHSAAFWRVVASVCPDYLVLRRELKALPLS